MTSELQQEILSALAEIRTLDPDTRLGQLFDFLGYLGEVHLGRKLADMDDDELLSVIYKHREDLTARAQQQVAATEVSLPGHAG